MEASYNQNGYPCRIISENVLDKSQICCKLPILIYTIMHCIESSLIRAMLPALDRNSILESHVARVTVELAGAATRGMLVVDRRVGSEISVSSKLSSVTIIDKMDEGLLMKRLERAFMNYK